MLEHKRKHVLMVVESFVRGGVERQILLLGEGLLQRGYEVRVFELVGAVSGQANFEEDLARLGITLWNIASFECAEPCSNDANVLFNSLAPLLRENHVSMCSALAAAIAEFAPDVVHCWSDFANMIGGFVAGTMGVPRIVIGQRVFPPPFWYGEEVSELYRQAYRQLASDPRVTFVNNSMTSGREYENWLALAPGTVRVVYNSIWSSAIKSDNTPAPSVCRKAFGLPAGVPVIGGLMRFAPEKDPALWIETAAVIARVRADTMFLLGGYGHGTIADDLYRKGVELGLGARLVMPGAIGETGAFYGALDAFLLTSRTENFGNVLIEAQAAGVPVVAPAVGGIPESMCEGVTGRLVAERSAPSLAAVVLEVLTDGAWRARAAAKGPDFVVKNFDQQRMVSENIAIYCGNYLGSQ